MPIEAASDPLYGNVQNQMRRMMDQMQKNFFNFCPSETWTPSVNLYESDQSYIVCVDLSGVDKDEIEVVVTDQKLTLRGTRAVPVIPEQAAGAERTPKYRVHVMEIDHGPFCREVDLPDNVNHHQITATHRNGMLWIELPKSRR